VINVACGTDDDGFHSTIMIQAAAFTLPSL
jgi:hypothetical protein